jgi:hypothetical protein
MVRLSAVAVPVLLAAAAALTPRNSVVAPLVSGDRVVIEGVGCAVPASAASALPSGAASVRVARPAIGARSFDARLTAVSILGEAVVLTAAADGPAICDPAEEATPPAERPWSAPFELEVAYRLRVGVVFRDDDRVRGAAFKVRPAEVRIGLAGAARGVRWTRFGRAHGHRVREVPVARPVRGWLLGQRDASAGAVDPARLLPGRPAARPQGGRRLLHQGRVRPRGAARRAEAGDGMDQHGPADVLHRPEADADPLSPRPLRASRG